MALQHDQLIWDVINGGFCSFKCKVATGGRSSSKRSTDHQVFCRNPNNVTGLCSRQACPLANSQYWTIREDKGWCYLYMKTIERAHSPKHMWERIKLPKDYAKALAMVDEHVQEASKFQKHKVKQRLTKIHQYLIRMRKLRMKVRPKMVRISKKIERQEENRERKALAAARLEKVIESELLERLKLGTYGDIYNWSQNGFNAALDAQGEDVPRLEVEEEEGTGGAARAARRKAGAGAAGGDDESSSESESDEEESYSDEDEGEGLGVGVREFVVGDSDDSSEESDVEDAADAWSWNDAATTSGARGTKRSATAAAAAASAAQPKRRRNRAYVEVEYEVEQEPKHKQKASTTSGW
jgi:protein MAK16